MAGKNVQYGQSVQLIHAKSGRFLTVTVKEFAELEKDCLRVILDAEGNEGSWYVLLGSRSVKFVLRTVIPKIITGRFVITPRFKMRSEGDPVSSLILNDND